jgi:hypothetical protein
VGPGQLVASRMGPAREWNGRGSLDVIEGILKLGVWEAKR